jgi:hypothetical protein
MGGYLDALGKWVGASFFGTGSEANSPFPQPLELGAKNKDLAGQMDALRSSLLDAKAAQS